MPRRPTLSSSIAAGATDLAMTPPLEDEVQADDMLLGEFDPTERGEVLTGAITQVAPTQILPVTRALDPARHPALQYLQTLAKGHSRRTMTQALQSIAAWASRGHATMLTLAWDAFEPHHSTVLRDALAESYAPATANKMLSAFRGTLKQAWRLGYLDAERYHRIVDIQPVRGSREPKGRHIGQEELDALAAHLRQDPRPAGVRDTAILTAFQAAGLRRAEVAALTIGRYDSAKRRLRITGKGNKERILYLPVEAAAVFDAWLVVRRPIASGPRDALFVPITKAGALVNRPLTDQAIFLILAKRALEAGLDHCSPHDFRRTFIGDLLDAGADLATVQGLAGHASPTTTSRYDRRGERAKRAAADLVRVPFSRPH